jgi:hypothetical protein
MTNKNIHPSSGAIDEALWAAYRRDDKAAVMEYLFRRSLVGTRCSRSFLRSLIKDSSQRSHGARGTHREPMLINDGARQIPLGFALN